MCLWLQNMYRCISVKWIFNSSIPVHITVNNAYHTSCGLSSLNRKMPFVNIYLVIWCLLRSVVICLFLPLPPLCVFTLHVVLNWLCIMYNSCIIAFLSTFCHFSNSSIVCVSRDTVALVLVYTSLLMMTVVSSQMSDVLQCVLDYECAYTLSFYTVHLNIKYLGIILTTLSLQVLKWGVPCCYSL